MMRGMLNLVVAVLFTIAAAVPSFGLDRHEQRNVYVSAGRETRIASYGAPNENCKAGARPEIEIAEWPSYGRLGDKPVRIIAERAGVARPDHPCIGKFIDAIALYYRPVAGFRGSDRVRLRVKFPTTPLAAATIMEEEIFIGVR
jgi:hypothetical protein